MTQKIRAHRHRLSVILVNYFHLNSLQNEYKHVVQYKPRKMHKNLSLQNANSIIISNVFLSRNIYRK